MSSSDESSRLKVSSTILLTSSLFNVIDTDIVYLKHQASDYKFGRRKFDDNSFGYFSHLLRSLPLLLLGRIFISLLSLRASLVFRCGNLYSTDGIEYKFVLGTVVLHNRLSNSVFLRFSLSDKRHMRDRETTTLIQFRMLHLIDRQSKSYFKLVVDIKHNKLPEMGMLNEY